MATFLMLQLIKVHSKPSRTETMITIWVHNAELPNLFIFNLSYHKALQNPASTSYLEVTLPYSKLQPSLDLVAGNFVEVHTNCKYKCSVLKCEAETDTDVSLFLPHLELRA